MSATVVVAGGGSGASGKFISSIVTRDITVNPKLLSEETRHYIDPLDKRTEMEMRFNPHPFLDFFIRGWLPMGIDDQYEVKCLIPIEDTIRYHAIMHGGSSVVHGSNLSIYDALQLLPINQELDLNTKFSITVPIVEPPYARAIFSDSIVPIDPRAIGTRIGKGMIPFNRRNFLLCIEPGESLSMQLRVGYLSNFSIRERTHWWPLKGTPKNGVIVGDGIAVGTQLGRHPVTYIQTIVTQLLKRLDATENNRFVYMLQRSGLLDYMVPMKDYVVAVSAEILALKAD